MIDPAAEILHAVRRPTPPRADRLALLLGSEAQGLSVRWIEGCDRRVTIPMSAGVDSLNVAQAAAVFLHHFTRPSP